jgi:hypothetical protein
MTQTLLCSPTRRVTSPSLPPDFQFGDIPPGVVDRQQIRRQLSVRSCPAKPRTDCPRRSCVWINWTTHATLRRG